MRNAVGNRLNGQQRTSQPRQSNRQKVQCYNSGTLLTDYSWGSAGVSAAAAGVALSKGPTAVYDPTCLPHIHRPGTTRPTLNSSRSYTHNYMRWGTLLCIRTGDGSTEGTAWMHPYHGSLASRTIAACLPRAR
jgi:hypothetical protein